MNERAWNNQFAKKENQLLNRKASDCDYQRSVLTETKTKTQKRRKRKIGRHVLIERGGGCEEKCFA